MQPYYLSIRHTAASEHTHEANSVPYSGAKRIQLAVCNPACSGQGVVPMPSLPSAAQSSPTASRSSGRIDMTILQRKHHFLTCARGVPFALLTPRTHAPALSHFHTRLLLLSCASCDQSPYSYRSQAPASSQPPLSCFPAHYSPFRSPGGVPRRGGVVSPRSKIAFWNARLCKTPLCALISHTRHSNITTPSTTHERCSVSSLRFLRSFVVK